jgi:acetyl esterase
MNKFFLICLLTVTAAVFAPAQEEKATPTDAAVKPKPAVADGKYGPFARNTFDFWKPASKRRTPLVVFIHGGGLSSGSKEKLSAVQLRKMLEAGFAVMAVNYRLTGEAVFPEHYLDCARAIQFARLHAADFNIDPELIAATGGSAGGMTALWLGFHDDLADPTSPDPVLRQSTRLKALAVSSAQTTLVAETVIKYVGARATEYGSYSNGKMFGLKKEEMTGPRGRQLYREISPLTYLTRGDPPVWAFYSVPDKPLTEQSTASEAIHHPGFGRVLKEEMDRLKIECRLRHKDDGRDVTGDMIAFLAKYLK